MIEINQWSGFNPESVRRQSGSSAADNPSYPYRDDDASSNASRKKRHHAQPGGKNGAGVGGINGFIPARAAFDEAPGIRRHAGRSNVSSASTIVASKNMGQGFTYTRTRGGNATVKLTMEAPAPGTSGTAGDARRSVRGLPPIPGAAPNTGGGGGGGAAGEPNEDSDQLDLNIFQSLRAPSQVFWVCV